jgi:hypothetical protein
MQGESVNLINFLAAILATWRIAAALYFEYGPGDAFLRLRQRADDSSPFWSKQLNCFWCCTFWAALLVLPFYLWLAWPLYPVAFSGAAVLLTHGGRIVHKEMIDHG